MHLDCSFVRISTSSWQLWAVYPLLDEKFRPDAKKRTQNTRFCNQMKQTVLSKNKIFPKKNTPKGGRFWLMQRGKMTHLYSALYATSCKKGQWVGFLGCFVAGIFQKELLCVWFRWSKEVSTSRWPRLTGVVSPAESFDVITGRWNWHHPWKRNHPKGGMIGSQCIVIVARHWGLVNKNPMKLNIYKHT